MKRLICLIICLLLLLTLVPVYTFAETSDGSASSATEDSQPESSEESEEESEEASDPASEEMSDSESSEPEPFVVHEWDWDKETGTLRVTWSAGADTLVEAVLIGTVQYPVNNSDGQFAVTLSELDFGRHTVSYILSCSGFPQKVEDSDPTHVIMLSGIRDTKIELLDNNKRATVRVLDSKFLPVAGVKVHLEAGSTAMTLTTDADGCATFPLLYSDVTHVYTEDLQTDYILYKSAVYPEPPPTTSTDTGMSTTVDPSLTTGMGEDTTTSTETTSTTTVTTEARPVINSTHTSSNSATSTVDSAQSQHATHVGAGTTSTQNNMIVINILTDEGVLESLQLEITDMDESACLMIDPATYAALFNENPNAAILLSILSSNRSYSAEQAKTWLEQELDEFEKDSIQSVTVDLGIIRWDMQAQTGTPATNLPKSSYVIRIPRPQNMESCNHFYIVDMSGDQPGAHTEAIVEAEYIQFTLQNSIGPVAIVACESETGSAKMYTHPLVYVFFALGILLILLAFALLYLFFFRERVLAWLNKRNDVTPDVSDDTDVLGEKSEDEEVQNANTTPEDAVSLDDILRKYSSNDE